MSRIRAAVEKRFPHLDAGARTALASQILQLNIVTACHFCNSTTSRATAKPTMDDLIAEAPVDPVAAVAFVEQKLQAVLEAKRKEVGKKIRAVRKVFDASVHGSLLHTREENPQLHSASTFSGSDVADTAPNRPPIAP